MTVKQYRYLGADQFVFWVRLAPGHALSMRPALFIPPLAVNLGLDIPAGFLNAWNGTVTWTDREGF